MTSYWQRAGCFGSWVFIWIYSNWQKCSPLKAKVLPPSVPADWRRAHLDVGFTLWILSAEVSTMRPSELVFPAQLQSSPRAPGSR